MKNKTLVILLALLVVLSLFTWGAVAYRKATQSEEAAVQAAPKEKLLRDGAWSLGDKNAPVTLVEFLDPECESCAAMAPITKQVLSEFGDRVYFQVRYMPLHANSKLAAASLEAAGKQGKFWEALELLFARQPIWADHHAPRPDLIPTILKPLGLDAKRFEADVKSGESLPLVERDQMDAIALGVRGTPTYFVNGRMLPDLGYGPLKQAIVEALSK